MDNIQNEEAIRHLFYWGDRQVINASRVLQMESVVFLAILKNDLQRICSKIGAYHMF